MGKATLVLGTKKGVLVLEQGQKGWRSKPLQHAGVAIPYAFFDGRTETLWASLDHGHWGQKLSRSRDGGATWEEVAPLKYPEKAESLGGKPATLRYIWFLAPGGKEEPGRLYAGTVPGGLFASDDGGKTFTLNSGLWDHPTRLTKWGGGGKDFDNPGLHSVVVDPRDRKRIWVGVSSGGVFETRDAGTSWEPRNKGTVATFLPDPTPEVGQDPHFVQCCEAEPDVLWQQNHCGVYRSTDGGRSWSDLKNGHPVVGFGFAVAASATDPGRAWLVPGTSDDKRYAVDAALCVARTDDGGKSWAILRDGLPQENAFDIVYRHALDARGDAVAFGSTTGNLYWSEDRGEHWTTVGNNFPPIQSVRFV
jgi:hypothetical protein